MPGKPHMECKAGYRHCRTCDKVMKEEFFYQSHKARCKQCYKAKQHAYYENMPAKQYVQHIKRTSKNIKKWLKIPKNWEKHKAVSLAYFHEVIKPDPEKYSQRKQDNLKYYHEHKNDPKFIKRRKAAYKKWLSKRTNSEESV
jgi:hypothetical protein